MEAAGILWDGMMERMAEGMDIDSNLDMRQDMD
jgi:hypothetical protein